MKRRSLNESGATRIHSLTAIIIGTFVLFMIFSFTQSSWTTGGSSDPVVYLEEVANSVDTADIAMNDDGDAVGVWSEYDGTYMSVYAAVLSDGSWGEVTLIEDQYGSSEVPRVVMNDDGDAVVVWIHSIYSNYDFGAQYEICAVVYSDDAWGEVTSIQQSTAYPSYLSIAMDQDGNTIVVWSDYYFSAYASEYSDGSWGTVITLVSASKEVYDPQIAMNYDGDAVVVWRQCDETDERGQPELISVYSKSYTEGSWGNSTRISSGERNTLGAQIAMSDNGDAVAVWYQISESGDHHDVCVSVLSDGSWGNATLIDSTEDDALSPRAAMDDDGDAVVVWYQTWYDYDELRSYSTVCASIYSGSVWETASVLGNSTGNYYARNPRVAVDDDCNAVVLWISDFGSGGSGIYSVGYTDGSWEDPVLLGNAEEDIRSHQIAMGGEGEAIAIWCTVDDYSNESVCVCSITEEGSSFPIVWVVASVLILASVSLTIWTAWKRKSR